MISLKYLDYKEDQPDQDRIKVHTPSIMVMAPVARVWSVTGTYVNDAVSGASPAYHTEQITKMHDTRRAADVSVTRYFPRGTLTVGGSYSVESDYLSRGFSAQGTVSTEDKNTTFNVGVGLTDDKVTPSYGGIHEQKNITDLLVGVTQVLTPQDIAQVNLGYSHGRGYYSDPYKLFDNRPRERDHTTLMARWNHHFSTWDGTSHLSYRYYTDNYGIRSHTLGAEYVQPLSSGWTVTPSARYYTQTAADFYLEVDPAVAPLPTIPPAGAVYFSEDQRLSEFGALTFGIKVAKQLNPDWLVDAKFEQYEQRSRWSLSGDGSSGLAPFSASSIQIGLSRQF